MKSMRSSLTWRSLIYVFLGIAIVEGSSALVCRLLSTFSQTSRFIWNPDLEQARSNWNAHALLADQEIGGFAASGAKQNSEFPGNAQSCGSAYGDSFVSGWEVADGDGWVERLSHALGCRVTNYAVGGYGTDQAYLRFQKISDDSAMVLLGIDSNSIMDVVSQYDGFLGSEPEPYLLKGRFLLDSYQHLQWAPQPHLDANGFVALHRNPAHVLPHSYFLPDTPDGPVTFRFPYAVTLARVALMPSLHDILARRAEWSGLYGAHHPSGALQLMVSISEAFVDLANARGKRPLIVVLPVAASFRQQANHGEFEYAPLVAALRAKHIDVFDPGAAMIAALGGHTACELFTHRHAETSFAWLASPLPCGGHYSSFGHEILARLVYAELRSRNFIRQ
jgi:hypothetical protein